MKFAKELEEDLVPEWRVKYLDYKLGKKKVKAVSRALAKVNQSPTAPRSIFRRRDPLPPTHPSYLTPRAAPRTASTERDPLRLNHNGSAALAAGYGSLQAPTSTLSNSIGPPALELPDPALSPSQASSAARTSPTAKGDDDHFPLRRTASAAGDKYETGRTHTASKLAATLLPKHRRPFNPRRTATTPDGASARARERPLIQRIFTDKFHRHGPNHYGSPTGSELQLSAYKAFEERQADFFTFLDQQLGMVDGFYKQKEDEATRRLEILRAQLHKMRDLRLKELERVRRKKAAEVRADEQGDGWKGHLGRTLEGMAGGDHNGHYKDPAGKHKPWYAPIEQRLGMGTYRFGGNTEALERLTPEEFDDPESDTPSTPDNGEDVHVNGAHPNQHHESHRDYSRRVRKDEKVPYERAKRQLKAAMQEFYRGLELLKSYTLLNRTAFRKINKKYDKAVQARPTMQFFTERVANAYFVQSGILEQCMVQVEDLYARYFARGNRKIAVGKLRSKTRSPEEFTQTVFRNGAFLAAGIILTVEGLLYAAPLITSEVGVDPTKSTQASYLLQIYGGYFISLVLFLFFCFDAGIWTRAKINYVFIFEFDTRHNLDWKQLAELPCLLFFIFGLIFFLNFIPYTPADMFIYWPVTLVGLSVLIVFMPLPILYHRSRFWWAYSNFRLLLAGLFPVEFRDFFLGDMYCSLTYVTGNIEVFFCLYAQHWSSPTQCNSSHSRLLGFFSTLPAVIRALQCIRRYVDTRAAFPHLVNCGKYICTILFYMTLSLYRIAPSDAGFYAFVFFASLNGTYTSIWDILFDWSLGDPNAKYRFLRRELGYKRPWVYYLAMLVDPLLRFNWVFYAIFRSQLQHSAILSFMVCLSEVCRRGIWTIFRVENEHCTNVGRFRASRDVTLPYSLPPEDDLPSQPRRSQDSTEAAHNKLAQYLPPSGTTAVDLEAGNTGATSPQTIRRRRVDGVPVAAVPQSPLMRGISRVGTAISMAHAQDFERKRRPDVITGKEAAQEPLGDVDAHADDDSDDEDEELLTGHQRAEDDLHVTEDNGAQTIVHEGNSLSVRGTLDRQVTGGELSEGDEADLRDIGNAEEILERQRSRRR